jgi:hypothetical protein
MSTTPTDPNEPAGPTSFTIGSGSGTIVRMPTPGNAEFLVWLVVVIVFAIIWAASDDLGGGGFVTATAIVTFAYLISRGIAKASRVLER